MKAKRWGTILLLLVFITGLPVTSRATEEKEFGIGSFIIPMDSIYQDNSDGGMLEAYGMVFDLLQNDITVHWILNEDKTSVDGADVVIEDTTLNASEAVVASYQSGVVSPLVFPGDDSYQSITYAGAPFVIDAGDAAAAKVIIDSANWSAVDVHQAQVPFSAPVYKEMHGTPPRIALMDSDETGTGNVEFLESYLRLAGICTDVYDVLTPNDIRDGKLMEPRTNAAGEKIDSNGAVTIDSKEYVYYDFLWAPHWAGYEISPYNTDDDNSGAMDVEEIVAKVREFLEDGNGLLAECASIEVFEHSDNGHFLSDKGFAQNGGWNDTGHLVYHDATTPNAQIGDLDYAPEGGHLHNWRPFQYGDDTFVSMEDGKTIQYMKDNLDSPQTSGIVTFGNDSVYNDTVTRFTMDTGADDDAATLDDNWDYYVGGYVDGNTDKGYAVYLGGHKYATCGGGKKGGGDAVYNKHEIEMEFKDDIPGGLDFWIDLQHAGGDWTGEMQVLAGGAIAGDHVYSSGGVDIFKLDLSQAEIKNKKVEKIYYENLTDSELVIDRIKVRWENGDPGAFKKHKDKDDKNTNYDDNAGVVSDTTVVFDPGVTLAAVPGETTGEDAGASSGCTANSDCSPINVAGVRYVLNTLFNIKYQLRSVEYARAGVVVDANNNGYYGTFEYPSYTGHFRKVDTSVDPADSSYVLWDLGDPTQNLIKEARAGNNQVDSSDNLVIGADGDPVPDSSARQVFTGKEDSGAWSFTDFDVYSLSYLRSKLDVTPDNDDDTDEKAVIERLRGKVWDPDANAGSGAWVENPGNRMGAVEHSVPAVATFNSYTGYEMEYDSTSGGLIRVGTDTDGDGQNDSFVRRKEVAYVGDLSGMLHAVDTATGNELWAYVPSNLLDKLQNDRADENAVEDFAAVDSSPMIHDVYVPIEIDHDDNAATPDITVHAWRTVLVCGEGKNGGGVFAIDVTDPEEPRLLWEVADSSMGDTERLSVGKLKNPVYKEDASGNTVYMEDASGNQITDADGNPIPVVEEFSLQYVAYAATSWPPNATGTGGIKVFCYDMMDGSIIWTFSEEYDTSVNGIPGPVTTFDKNRDSFVDMLFVGDNQGRMWQLDPMTGDSAYGTCTDTAGNTKTVPLHFAGSKRPITHSPVVGRRDEEVVVIFGTGGADWADTSIQHYVAAVSATSHNPTGQWCTDGAGLVKWKEWLAAGEKVYAAPVAAGDMCYFTSATGSLNSSDPKNDLSGSGFMYGLSIGETDDSQRQKFRSPLDAKNRGALYIRDGNVHGTTVDGSAIKRDESGNIDDSASGIDVGIRSWRVIDLE